MTLVQRLRDAVASVRRKSYPISDLVPLLQQAADALEKPIDMVLHCPECGLQHVDKDEWERDPHDMEQGLIQTWKNEPHRSHLCHGCGHIWRPADVATNGVAAVATKGKADSPIASKMSLEKP
jgi:rubredoxin